MKNILSSIKEMVGYPETEDSYTEQHSEVDCLEMYNNPPLTQTQKETIAFIEGEIKKFKQTLAIKYAQFKSGEYVNVIAGIYYYKGERCIIWGVPSLDSRNEILYALKNKAGVYWEIPERHLVLSNKQSF